MKDYSLGLGLLQTDKRGRLKMRCVLNLDNILYDKIDLNPHMLHRKINPSNSLDCVADFILRNWRKLPL